MTTSIQKKKVYELCNAILPELSLKYHDLFRFLVNWFMRDEIIIVHKYLSIHLNSATYALLMFVDYIVDVYYFSDYSNILALIDYFFPHSSISKNTIWLHYDIHQLYLYHTLCTDASNSYMLTLQSNFNKHQTISVPWHPLMHHFCTFKNNIKRTFMILWKHRMPTDIIIIIINKK